MSQFSLDNLPSKINSLGVSLPGFSGKGLLEQKAQYSFLCRDIASPISITMPVRSEPYNHGSLLPIFEMNLPEGFIRHRLHEKLLRYTDPSDLLFLALQGNQGIGKLCYTSEYENELNKIPKNSDNLNDILSWDKRESIFEYLLNRYLLGPHASGVQPKVLASSNEKATMVAPDLIIKSGDEEYPHLAFNEFICMDMAKHCGLSVPEFWLSDNKTLFIMRRFDLTETTSLGMEDMCVLMKKSSQQKYQSSYEMIAKAVKNNCTHPEDIENLFRYIVYSCLVGNGDAHLKNFSILYENLESDINLSPLYDVVCTAPYPTTDNRLALKMNKSNAFPNLKGLIQFGKTIEIPNPSIIIETLADDMASYINQCDQWSIFPQLKTAIERSLSHGTSSHVLKPH